MHQEGPGKFFTMSSQAAVAQPSSGLQLPYSRTQRRIDHHQPPNFIQPLRTQQQQRDGQQQKQQIGILRLLLTVPFFKEHYERTRLEFIDLQDDEEDYVFVEHDTYGKMVQLTEVPDEHFEGQQPGPVEDDGDFTDTGKFHPRAFLISRTKPERVVNHEDRDGKTKG